MTLPRPSKWHKLTKLFLAVTLAIAVGAGTQVLSSCDNGCEQTRENYMHVDFTSTSGRTLTSLSVIASSGDVSTESQSFSSFTDIELDLNPNANSTTLLLTCSYTDYGDSYTVTDSVKIDYETQAKFLDMACGCTMLYTITSVNASHNLLGDVKLTNAEVYPDGGTNITFEY